MASTGLKHLIRKLNWAIMQWKSKDSIFRCVQDGTITVRDGVELLEMQRKLTLMARILM